MNTENKAKPKAQVKRGRTGSDLPPAMKDSQTGLVAKSREETVRSGGRPTRVPLHKSKSSNLPEHLKEEGFFYYEFLDRPGRIDAALKAGFEFVLDEQGNQFSYPAGNLKHVIMKQPMEYRNEDLQYKKEAAATARHEDKKKLDDEFDDI